MAAQLVAAIQVNMVVRRAVGRIEMVAVLGTAIAAAIGSAGSARANPFAEKFQSPSGDITCELVNYPPNDQRSLAKNFAQCDVVNQSWVPPKPPPPGRPDATSTLVLMRGELPIVGYSPGALAATEPTYYDEPVSGGAITCDADQSTMTCTDTSTGHFFRVSHDSYQLG
jgi:hypothetical protein